MNGGCTSPIAAYARMESGGSLRVTGLYAEEGSTEYQVEVTSGKKEQAETLGEELARKMR